jgi:hypothetical protein
VRRTQHAADVGRERVARLPVLRARLFGELQVLFPRLFEVREGGSHQRSHRGEDDADDVHAFRQKSPQQPSTAAQQRDAQRREEERAQRAQER